ncbi:hypothetical protein NUW54_g5777 [Trametes sanguinea]|uniref:Uncharacterized protein n=1 Tax=Trametes sanguinea TaxID=158606 RepID=A0ACC1PU43_9APHY|nr:hypothetical protein NUW54_g5777 [Trametes sanguinea]
MIETDVAATSYSTLATSTVHDHLRVRCAMYTTIIGGQTVLPWTCATILIAEILQPGPHRSLWSLGIHPPPTHTTVTIDMMSTEWTLQWEEPGVQKTCMIIYRTGASEEESVRHCILVHDITEFLRLTNLCANARVYKYLPFPMKIPICL